MVFLDFFAGIGGLRIGMEKAGHKCAGHCEIDKWADMSYRMMHTVTEEQRKYLMSMSLKDRQKEIRKDEYLNGEWFADDVRRVDAGDLPEADCYCLGFPCQSFSIAGKRRGFEDTRGTLFFEIMRLVKERKPKILFAENVKGLLSHEGGATFGTIIRTMDELGYDVQWQLLNSKYYVPQNRERVYIVGCARTGCAAEVFPITGNSEEADELQGQSSVQTININRADGTEQYQQDRIYDTEGIAPALARGKSDLNIIANTITTRTGDAAGGGTYPIGNNGGVLKVNGYHKK